MKNKIYLQALCFALSSVLYAQGIEFSEDDWQNPAMFEKGQTSAHSFHIPFETKEAAMSEDSLKSQCIKSLNGSWDFLWVSVPQEVPHDFWMPDFDVTEWDKIPVPSNWQMEGYGHPKFRNISLSFESDPPNIPDYYNPVGCYRRNFTIPGSWFNKVVTLRFEGVKSAAYIWLNGQRVGYNQGGFEPAEFDLSPYLKEGENVLAVEVLRFSDGSYLENQDMWRLSGIFRDVIIYAQPKLHIRDHYILTELDDDHRDARMILNTKLFNTGSTDQAVTLEVELIDSEGSLSELGTSKKNTLVKGNSELELVQEIPVKNPQKWSAEFPYRYTLSVVLKNQDGGVLEAFTRKIGFREIAYIDNIFTVNGVPVKLNGINSHMHHPEKGQAVPLKTMRKDLELMKQFNLNCVRTSHYPPSPAYIDLADELGIYIIDEVGDEAHNNLQLSEDPAWTAMYRDRSKKLVYRDRNHPSVIMWSAGNESGSGHNIKTVIETGKEIDPSRPAWMYGGNTFYIPFEDVVGPRYWLPLWLEKLVEGEVLKKADDRSSFMDEYLAATGNGLGGLDEYWEIIRKNPRSMGGAIWDFVSPGIKTPRWILPDRSPLKNEGQIMGRPTFVDGKSGRGLQFSGHDDWVEFYRDPSLDITGNSLSIGFWLKASSIPDKNVFVSKGDHQYGIQMQHRDTLEFYINSIKPGFISNKTRRISAKAMIGDDFYEQWHHIAGIYDGSKLRLYLDNRVIAETEFEGSISHSPFPLCLGREPENQDQGEQSGRMSSMVLDELRIFDRAVSPEIMESNIQETVLAIDFENDEKNGDFYATGLGGRTYGVVWPDRKVQPEIYQIKKSGQPIEFEMISNDPVLVQITNHHHFKNLNELDAFWTLQQDGIELEKGLLQVELAPGDSGQFPIKIKQLPTEGELILTLGFSLKTEENWGPKGHEIAWEQFVLQSKNSDLPDHYKMGALNVIQDTLSIQISGEDFTYTLDKLSGQWTSMIFKGTEYLEGRPEFIVWRAPLANDVDPWGAYKYSSHFMTQGYGRSIDNQLRTLGMRNLVHHAENIKVAKREGHVKIELKAWSSSSKSSELLREIGSGFSAFERREVWKIYPGGTLELEQEVTPHGEMPNMLPREGIQWKLPKSFSQVSWYGRGPFENYPDRKTGAKIGLYQSDAMSMYEPYIMPQDYGNRSDIRWVKVEDKQGRGLLISGDQLLNFSLHPYTTENLSRAVYNYQLREAAHMTLNLDYRVSGVGGTALRQLQAYRVKPSVINHRLRIKPY